MVYVIAIVGFIGGFVLGQYLLMKILKNRTKDELLSNKKLHWIYGPMNWLIAFFISYLAVSYYQTLNF